MAQKRGRIALLVMSIVCAVTFTTGMLTLNGGTAKAAETTLYSADFENLSDASTADDIFQNTGIAGGNRSIVTARPNHIHAIYTFYDNGCALATSRSVPAEMKVCCRALICAERIEMSFSVI